jgi:photosystem II cytochrome c550
MALKSKFLVGSILATFVLHSFPLSVNALELDEDTRTVTLEPKGTTVVLSVEQVKRGKRLFNNACAICHVGGMTKTNPNVGLDVEALSLATPPRDNVSSLVAYLKDPMTYDGADSISELHPSIKSADIFPKMRSLTDEDLFAISGHILVQPKVVNEKWGGGKIYY